MKQKGPAKKLLNTGFEFPDHDASLSRYTIGKAIEQTPIYKEVSEKPASAIFKKKCHQVNLLSAIHPNREL